MLTRPSQISAIYDTFYGTRCLDTAPSKQRLSEGNVKHNDKDRKGMFMRFLKKIFILRESLIQKMYQGQYLITRQQLVTTENNNFLK